MKPILLALSLLALAACSNPASSSSTTSAATGLAGVVTTFAGSTASGFTDGIGAAAQFSGPAAISTDGTNLYVVDQDNNAIRKIVISTGEVTTLAGSTISGSTDGTGTAARFNQPAGVATDGTNLYVADWGTNMIRKIVIATGEVTTLAGSTARDSTDGTGTDARFSYPAGVTTDGTNLYVTDSGNSSIRKVVIASGVVITIAGSTASGSTDGTGTAARFDYPTGIATDGTNLYVADSNNHSIRKVAIATGVVTTFAGSTASGSTDGTGTAARFSVPRGMATDGTNLYVADMGNNNIRKVVIATGVVTTLAGSTRGSTDGTGAAAGFYGPRGMAISSDDPSRLFVADYNNRMIRMIR